MLTAATLGLAGYGVYEIAVALIDLLRPSPREVWVNVAAIPFGLLLVIAGALVRVQMPGGVALAMSGLLAFQAFALHKAAHLTGTIDLAAQLGRGLFAAVLVALASLGTRSPAR